MAFEKPRSASTNGSQMMKPLITVLWHWSRIFLCQPWFKTAYGFVEAQRQTDKGGTGNAGSAPSKSGPPSSSASAEENGKHMRVLRECFPSRAQEKNLLIQSSRVGARDYAQPVSDNFVAIGWMKASSG
eukprot:CAMPEP_0196651392 /NCGR_PEP_ID=MMETSP1086-20130531/247_1 /TAXON_ID=77921 /ORGANISM="Cyanoptyche  gloeocystis , Strain SAG4.97" /LENGTH=128 /DNA_ID=CAMNT_0041981349 /DNA_START=419 /DNA_END=806 /DNA_ORIENTATION=-